MRDRQFWARTTTISAVMTALSLSPSAVNTCLDGRLSGHKSRISSPFLSLSLPCLEYYNSRAEALQMSAFVDQRRRNFKLSIVWLAGRQPHTWVVCCIKNSLVYRHKGMQRGQGMARVTNDPLRPQPRSLFSTPSRSSILSICFVGSG